MAGEAVNPPVNEGGGSAYVAATALRGEKMKTSATKRLARPAGLLLLSLLVMALAVPAAQATASVGSGAGSGYASATTTPPAGTQGRGGVAAAPFSTTSVTQPVSSGAQSSSGTSSTTAWIAVGSAAAVLVVGLALWATIRRRRQPGSVAYCRRHPSDSLCTTV